ncbi:cbb3-type cytochrome oxidase assembly protein CcoS [Coralloluteibacterium thermophilus]|uniref:Cbb3-type cytochrome oxidase assembly protein CcoS n=1 Tax=Coralloluteibacterium thermophilum TaxID=2707049 RepID=A0ABV9NHV9_9GAMM
MNIILLLIPLSIVLLCVGVWAFFWAVNHSQFDDLDTPALTPLSEDRPLPPRGSGEPRAEDGDAR